MTYPEGKLTLKRDKRAVCGSLAESADGVVPGLRVEDGMLWQCGAVPSLCSAENRTSGCLCDFRCTESVPRRSRLTAIGSQSSGYRVGRDHHLWANPKQPLWERAGSSAAVEQLRIKFTLKVAFCLSPLAEQKDSLGKKTSRSKQPVKPHYRLPA